MCNLQRPWPSDTAPYKTVRTDHSKLHPSLLCCIETQAQVHLQWSLIKDLGRTRLGSLDVEPSPGAQDRRAPPREPQRQAECCETLVPSTPATKALGPSITEASRVQVEEDKILCPVPRPRSSRQSPSRRLQLAEGTIGTTCVGLGLRRICFWPGTATSSRWRWRWAGRCWTGRCRNNLILTSRPRKGHPSTKYVGESRLDRGPKIPSTSDGLRSIRPYQGGNTRLPQRTGIELIDGEKNLQSRS